MITTIAYTAILTAANLVPPGGIVVDHSQPYHWTQPTIRRFERRAEDDSRRAGWNEFNAELEKLWAEFEKAKRTPEAWETYKSGVRKARTNYVFQDPYYAPIVH